MGQFDEDEFIDQIIQKQSTTRNLPENLVKEYESLPWMELKLVYSTSKTTKAMEFGPHKSLKINSNHSNGEEEHLCHIFKENLEAFSWD